MKKNENTSQTSEKLLQRYLADSSLAPFLIHQRYHNRLISFARARLLNVLKSKVDPEDVAQETFATFFDLADQGAIDWQQNGDLWRLLAGIAVNKTKQKFDFYSAAKRDPRLETSLEQNDLADLNSNVDQNASAQTLQELLEQLLISEKPLVRSVVQLRLAGYKKAEIAERIGRSSRTVGRIIESLQAKLIADNGLGFGTLNQLQKPKNSNAKPKPQPLADPTTQALDEVRHYADFQLLKMIGQGSFAKVYLAREHSTGDFYALKAIRKRWLGDLDARVSFTNEAQILNRLNDPHIVKFYGTGVLPNQTVFLLLELVEGTPITTAAKYAEATVIQKWLDTIQTTIGRVHELGIVHGDIRASNILIDPAAQVRIIDFGLGGFLRARDKASISNDLRAIESLRSGLIQQGVK